MREKIVGWYSTGPKIRPMDSRINELFRQYCPNPIFLIIDVQLKEVGLPTKAYVSVEEVLEVRSGITNLRPYFARFLGSVL